MAEQTQTFKEKWLAAVKEKNSILCAGLDPAEFAMGRKEKGLSEGADKLDWAFKYIGAVAPYCAALKPNIQYWKQNGDMQGLEMVIDRAHQEGMVVIEDSKLADIGTTNDAGMFYARHKTVDAITLALFAGNIQEAEKQLRKREIGGIHMCLMSNSDYEREKKKLVPLTGEEEMGYTTKDVITFGDGSKFIPQYIQLAHNSHKFGLDGIVIGAPSKSDPEKGIKGNHITEYEIQTASRYFPDGLVLVPGVGAQGGNAAALFKYFNADHLIVSESRSLMLPNGSNSTPAQQAAAAEKSRDMLNRFRASAT